MGADKQVGYDVVIIGSGTAGVTAAGILSGAGKRIAVIDKRPFGGTCALRGCQPKKYLVTAAHLAAQTQALQGRGLTASRVEWEQLQQFKNSFTDPFPEAAETSLQDKGIDTYHGTATFTAPKVIKLEESGLNITAEQVLIASGSYSRALPLEGSEFLLTSDDFLELEHLPKRLIFIGGGYISLEFAFIAGLCGSEVTVLQKGPEMLPAFPRSIVNPVCKEAADWNISMVTGVDVRSIRKDGTGYIVETGNKGEFSGDFVMSAIGRVPDIEQLNLSAAGVDYSKGGILTDRYMQTSAEGVYAAGDCVASKLLSPISDMEGTAAAENMLNPQSNAVDYDLIPSVVFTHPQMASIGMSSEQAKGSTRKLKTERGSGGSWPNYKRLNTEQVYYEVLIDTDTDQIAGAHLVSPYAGELINLFALAMRNALPASAIKSLPWAYPTYTSDVKYMV
ncbi:MAG: dihydrolipoyl dehydrogenase family protein [Spirochaetota bacterium]